jgi:hypothetical protein
MSLLNLDVRIDLMQYAGLIGTELGWLSGNPVLASVLFIPDAYNGPDINEYRQKIMQVFSSLRISVNFISDGDPVQMIRDAGCIAVGGGSLEILLKATDRYKADLKAAIARKVPFIGWNEGAVLACPGYVVPDPVPGYPACLGATNFQYYMNFVDSSQARTKMKDFLNRYQTANPPVTSVYTLATVPTGTGVRLEDDIVGIDYAGNTPVDPTRKFTLGDLT